MMALFHTYVPLPHMVMQIIDNVTTICLLMAMVALGLNVSFKDLKDRAFKPLIAVIIVSYNVMNKHNHYHRIINYYI